MVLRRGPRHTMRLADRRWRAALLCLLAGAWWAAAMAGRPAAAAAADSPRAAEVTLPLHDYLALVDSAERADAVRKAAAHREPAVAAVVTQRAAIQIRATAEGRAAAGGGGPAPAVGTAASADGAASLDVRIDSQLEVLIQGRSTAPVALPLAGLAVAVEVRPADGGTGTAAAGAGEDGAGLALVAPEPGRYLVRTRSTENVEDSSGGLRVALPRIAAPVAEVDVDLPGDLAWECAGAVAIDDRVERGRRLLRLTAPRGSEPVLVLRRAVAGDQASELLLQDVVATFLQLTPEGLRRHDVVLYDVARGALADLVVEVPPGLEVDGAATDEGMVIPVVEGNRLIVHRQRRLRAAGYLVLSSRPATAPAAPTAGTAETTGTAPAAGGAPGVLALALAPVRPATAPRARYLAVSSALPGGMAPRPAARWERVDLDDLPAALRGAVAVLDTAAAWRLTAGGDGADVGVEITTAPQATALETVVRRRLTTTLLTADGTLLHRDRFELAQAGPVLSLTLPAGATLWSAALDGTPVRPLQRDSRVDVPLGGGAQVVEVVEVLERAIASGRSRLTLDLAQVRAPVIEHRWRLLLPASSRYRIAGGALRPVPASGPPGPGVTWLGVPASGPPAQGRAWSNIPASRDPWTVLAGTPGVLSDRVNVGGSESGAQSAYVGPGAAGAQPAALSGRVVDTEGAPLPGVQMALAPEEGDRLVQVTGTHGEFAFGGVRPGTYRLKAQVDGFGMVDEGPFRLDAGVARQLQVTLSSVIEDAITVTSESPLLDERKQGNGISVSLDAARSLPAAPSRQRPAPAAAASGAELDELRQGLVDGVRPLPISIPEDGKALLLAGVLPPERVTLDLEVRSGRR
jgi:hypothetical protein